MNQRQKRFRLEKQAILLAIEIDNCICLLRKKIEARQHNDGDFDKLAKLVRVSDRAHARAQRRFAKAFFKPDE